jgi:hypothetical protein
MKKKLFIMLFMLTTIAVTIVVGFRYYSTQKQEKYATTAVPYLLKVIPELSKWDPVIARDYMSEEFMQSTSPADFANALKGLSRVGQLESLGVPQFEEIYTDNRQSIISYKVSAKYTTGAAEITIAILDQKNDFSVYRFNVRSAALAR